MGLKLKTAPAALPVTLEQAKAQCAVEHFDHDVSITGLIAAATSHLDGRSGILGCCLIEQTWELYYDTFPDGPLKIPLGPVSEIVSVEYADPVTGVMTVWSAANYEVDLVSLDAWVVPVDSWPTAMETVNAVRVTFKAGYGAGPDAVPAAIRHAILMMVGHWYANREAATGDKSVTEVPMGVRALLAPLSRVGV